MVAAIKPHPSHLREALDALGTQPARAIMVGDSAADVESARGATAYGYSPIPVHDLGTDVVIEDFAELPGAIEGLFRG